MSFDAILTTLVGLLGAGGGFLAAYTGLLNVRKGRQSDMIMRINYLEEQNDRLDNENDELLKLNEDLKRENQRLRRMLGRGHTSEQP